MDCTALYAGLTNIFCRRGGGKEKDVHFAMKSISLLKLFFVSPPNFLFFKANVRALINFFPFALTTFSRVRAIWS